MLYNRAENNIEEQHGRRIITRNVVVGRESINARLAPRACRAGAVATTATQQIYGHHRARALFMRRIGRSFPLPPRWRLRGENSLQRAPRLAYRAIRNQRQQKYRISGMREYQQAWMEIMAIERRFTAAAAIDVKISGKRSDERRRPAAQQRRQKRWRRYRFPAEMGIRHGQRHHRVNGALRFLGGVAWI